MFKLHKPSIARLKLNYVSLPTPLIFRYYLPLMEDSEEMVNRARIFKLLRISRFDSKESILPVSVAWRAGTITLFLLDS